MSTAELIDSSAMAIQCDDWPVRPLGVCLGTRESRFQVVFSQSALDEIHLHGQGSNDIEVCGVLIGNGFRDEQGPYLLVEHCIRGNGARAKATNVTFTGETWAHIQSVMDERFADRKMVGWYHTHPGFGIFLSDMDVFICENFFNLPWQIAFVYDPLSGDEGNFTWTGGSTSREPILIEDDVTPQSASIDLISTADAMDTVKPVLSEAEAEMIELRIRVRRLERRSKTMAIIVVFLAAFQIMVTLEFTLPAANSMARPATQPAIQINK